MAVFDHLRGDSERRCYGKNAQVIVNFTINAVSDRTWLLRHILIYDVQAAYAEFGE